MATYTGLVVTVFSWTRCRGRKIASFAEDKQADAIWLPSQYSCNTRPQTTYNVEELVTSA